MEPKVPIILETWGDLRRQGFTVNAWCHRCARSNKLDLAAMPADRSYVGAKLRCSQCGRNDQTSFTLGAPTRPVSQ